VSKLMARRRAEGDEAFEPGPGGRTAHRPRPRRAPSIWSCGCKQLGEAGLDAGADTIGWHLTHRHHLTLSRATINRILVRSGVVTPEPAKRPKSSYIRFEAE
jgi:hypothetical protein